MKRWIICSLLAACTTTPSADEGELWEGNVTLVSSYWKDVLGGQDQLRTGQSLYLQTVNPALVTPGARYELRIANQTTGDVLVEATSLADARGMFEMSPVLHDIGQDDGIAQDDRLEIVLELGDRRFVTEVGVATRNPGESFSSQAVDPLVYAADERGVAHNAFVADADHLDHEPYGNVYAAASGIPLGVTEVDVYLVRDRDRWAGQAIPRTAGQGLIEGPLLGKVVDGVMTPVNTGFSPGVDDLGVYDILVDVDRNGVFDYEYDHKDGADGEAKIGLTVQRSAKWLAQLADKHVLVNLAYDSPSRGGGTFRNIYRRGEKLYVYVNPPVNKEFHGKVTKWLVAHRDFATFWDKPGPDGTVDFTPYVITDFDGVPQTGCTNTPPTFVGETDTFTDPETGEPATDIDIVLDYNGDGRYEPGVDILDVTRLDEVATMIDPDAARLQGIGGLHIE